MDFHYILGFGNIVPSTIHANDAYWIENETKRRAVSERWRKRESCHVQSERGSSVGQWSSEVE